VNSPQDLADELGAETLTRISHQNLAIHPPLLWTTIRTAVFLSMVGEVQN
jgi:hypothetical protein